MANRKREITLRIPTPEELRIASNWLIYEYWMLKGLAQLLQRNDEVTENGLLRNAMLDSFLIHARALVDFFYRKPEHPDDVVAGHYFSGTEKAVWEEHYSENPAWFENTRTQINKGVAHISDARRKDSWDFLLIEREISKAFDNFVNCVSLDLLGTRWEIIKRNIRNGNESPIELPSFLTKVDAFKTSFYPLPNPDWYPDNQGDLHEH